MKQSFWKRVATLVCALTLCVVGLTAHNTAQAAGLAQTKNLNVTVENNQVKLKWNKVVGGADGFADLVSYANQTGFKIYPDFDFAYNHWRDMFDGFSLKRDAIKTIDDRYTRRRAYVA